MKARIVPLYFTEANEREQQEFAQQLNRLKELYGEVADFLEPAVVGSSINDIKEHNKSRRV